MIRIKHRIGSLKENFIFKLVNQSLSLVFVITVKVKRIQTAISLMKNLNPFVIFQITLNSEN